MLGEKNREKLGEFGEREKGKNERMEEGKKW
jgi:hypothetical protein